ncbi:hypothetical protein EN994_31915, partial [Mesorhizobium sp. M7A.F.Ca.CA.002.09.1.1]
MTLFASQQEDSPTSSGDRKNAPTRFTTDMLVRYHCLRTSFRRLPVTSRFGLSAALATPFDASGQIATALMV